MSHDIQPLARVVDAIAFAAHAHRAQRRKDADATPYINHPVALVRILAVEAGIDDPDVLCAAALHDYLEDCCGRDGQPSLEEGRRQLRDRFGEAVLAYVEAWSSWPTRSRTFGTSSSSRRRIGRRTGGGSTSTGRLRWLPGCGALMGNSKRSST